MPKSPAPKSNERVYQIKVTLMGVRPPVWRRLVVPSSISLGALHDVLQTAMGWMGGHLHQFVTPEQTRYGVPDPEFDDDSLNNEERVRLDKLLRREKAWLVYEYDFGDGWEHKIVLEKAVPSPGAVAAPRCIGGKRACPPEDCGGVPGYDNFLDAIRNPSHPEHKDMLEWIGGEFDPEEFDAEAINIMLGARTRRARPKD